jgi:hypothetical protein
MRSLSKAQLAPLGMTQPKSLVLCAKDDHDPQQRDADDDDQRDQGDG